MYDVGCRSPTKASIGGQTGFNISVTNDDHTYSNEITAVRTDKHCANCLQSGTSCTVWVHVNVDVPTGINVSPVTIWTNAATNPGPPMA
ncbi:hypothetical protein MAR_013631 [Mya arenaria]|uniref:Uncharacterized protein n=1 Tax=Mya arenaria TaxID=6604 RepID=A0ABY7G3M7_MYAAR|nr:hypothetical protein MAR_013631 [Mya arenaria]